MLHRRWTLALGEAYGVGLQVGNESGDQTGDGGLCLNVGA